MMRRSTALTACAVLATCLACGTTSDSTTVTQAQRGEGGAAAGVNNNRDRDPAATQAVTVEGCLRQGGGMFGGYLLATVNQPSSVGTAGSLPRSVSSEERGEMRMAASTYRLDAPGDVKLSDMIGKQVRVTGAAEQRGRSVPPSSSDVVKLDVSTATVIAESCGGAASGHPRANTPAEWSKPHPVESITGRN